MASLKDLRNRIASVKATQKITKAMQMVAAAKLRRAQEAAEAARPYAERMDAVLANLAVAFEGRQDAPRLMTGTGKDDVHLLVVCTADRGLCGGFNNSIVKLAKERARRLQADGKEVKILCVGKKGFDILRRDFGKLVVDTISLREVKKLGFGHADDIGKRLLAMFDDEAFDVCTLFYAEFQSVISQIPTEQQLIPAAVPEGAETVDLQGAIYEYEPDEGEILQDLLPRNVSVQVFRALLENAASEQGARMSAMDNATRNAGEMIDKLTTSYNRQRQAQITTELIEIIAGAEAL
ncbi:ATP synthase F1 subcomplex gamma subunit [Breoghania corrubedonensis]|uniref:ATP synthase gamma chain n=1 Tax=Breoghania corrubedonensis TaxID=665038 RepID=A0A2T5VGU6_9HYPH|nr:F0F1 ATP synthase subunit gamma [Breoghania corrubedonensis]PTW62981.1 ATP synthase F1 subcomplex gamma subunit [Breoghania corrubedonensis]